MGFWGISLFENTKNLVKQIKFTNFQEGNLNLTLWTCHILLEDWFALITSSYFYIFLVVTPTVPTGSQTGAGGAMASLFDFFDVEYFRWYWPTGWSMCLLVVVVFFCGSFWTTKKHLKKTAKKLRQMFVRFLWDIKRISPWFARIPSNNSYSIGSGTSFVEKTPPGVRHLGFCRRKIIETPTEPEGVCFLLGRMCQVVSLGACNKDRQ